MEILGSGWGKLLLFGEHSAVQGYPALGLALPSTLQVKWIPQKHRPWQLEGEALAHSEEFSPLSEHLQALIPQLADYGGILNVTSSIPEGSGFGSSGALSVALARCLSKGLSLSQSLEDIWDLAHNIEAFYHGTPSGIDTALALTPGVKGVRPKIHHSGGFEDLPPFPYPLVYGTVPRTESTKTLVASVRKQGKTPAGQRTLMDLGKITEAAISLCRKPSSPEDWGELIQKAQEGLISLGLGSPLQDRILQKGIQAGALGGKLSGAGGGGAFYLLFDHEDKARAYSEELTHQGVLAEVIT